MNDRIVEAIRGWRFDPIRFVREVLGAEPDGWQANVLNAMLDHKQIAMLACKGPGKSCLEAWAIWWFLTTRSHPNVYATSVTGDNLSDGLWTELAIWRKRAPLLEAQFSWTAEKVALKGHEDTWYAAARTWSKTANAEEQAETLAGKHNDSIMFVMDESGGIPDAVAITAEAILANPGDKIILQGGNPSVREGPLWRAAGKERDLWFVQEITGDPEDPNRSPRIDPVWAQKMIDKWGRDNDWVRINVLGKFPKTGSTNLIGDADTTTASQRRIPHRDFRAYPRIMSVDVARHGTDESDIFFRQGPMSWKPKSLRIPDLMLLTDAIAGIIKKWKPHAVFVDANGMGWAVVDALRRLGYSHLVIPVDVTKAAEDPRRYHNKTAECWGRMADWIKTVGQICDDEPFHDELTCRRYGFHPKTQALLLETKKEMKSRGVKSPNKADSCALGFAMDVPMPNPLELSEHTVLQGEEEWDYHPHEHGA